MASAQVLARSTPASRDRYVDLLRAAAIVVVILGHWLMAALSVDGGGGLTGRNLLDVRPGLQVLTWLFQVMPVFFLVGGFSNAASWTAARRDGVGYGQWLGGRTSRLTRPAAVFVGVWLTAAAVLPVPPAATRLLALPLWFLAVYLLVVAAAPMMVALHDRFGWRVAGGLAVAAAVGDLLPMPLALANFAFVWLFAHQLGLLWRDGVLRRPAVLVAGGLGGLIGLTTIGGYEVSMVGANTNPPTLALVALATWQTGAVLLARPVVDRWLQRPRVWVAVVAANGVSMTLYLWHLTALLVVAAVLLPSGLFPQPGTGTAAWWLLRPLWLALLAVAVVPLVALFARFERPRPGARRGPRTALLGTLGAAGAMTYLALSGF